MKRRLQVHIRAGVTGSGQSRYLCGRIGPLAQFESRHVERAALDRTPGALARVNCTGCIAVHKDSSNLALELAGGRSAQVLHKVFS